MITEFNTSTPGSTVKKGSSNTIILLIGLGIVWYLGYRYVYLPYKERKQNEQNG